MSAEGYQKQVKEMYENCLENAKAINGRLGYGYNADTYAKAAAKSLPDVEALLQQPHDAEIPFAFELMMWLASHVHGDLDVKGGCGYGGSGKAYGMMDAMIMRVISRRLQLKGVTRDMSWMKDALEELRRKRDHITKYGLKGYFPDTITGLSELVGDLVEEKKLA
jgi:hypothetical protein